MGHSCTVISFALGEYTLTRMIPNSGSLRQVFRLLQVLFALGTPKTFGVLFQIARGFEITPFLLWYYW